MMALFLGDLWGMSKGGLESDSQQSKHILSAVEKFQ